MSISTYAELQTAVGNWLGRSDLTARIPEFITLAEADMRRQLRDKKALAALTLTSGSDLKALPSTVKELESIRYDTTTRTYALRQKSPAALAALRRAGSGVPSAYAVVDGTIYFDITADAAYTMEITYIEKITAISAGVTSTLTNSPDIYLFGALKEAAPYLEHDERVALWEQKYAAAIANENIYRERAEFGATPEMELAVVFGGEE